MNTAITCVSCGNTIDPHYRYCPFCGNRKPPAPPLGKMLDGTFQKIEKVRLKNYLLRLGTLEHTLETLATELDRFVASKP